MLLVRSIVADALIFLLMGVMGLLCLPLAAWSRAGAYWSIRQYCRLALGILRILCGIRVEVRGEVPTGDVIVASKHQSFLDILIHSRTLPTPRFVMKNQLKWAPIIGLYALRIGSTPVHRGKKGQAVQSMVRRTAQQTDPGQLVIYPQGTRVLPGAKLPYKVGAGVLYERMGKPCIPAATNAGVFWARRSWLRHPGLAVVEYLPEIPAGLPLDTFMKRMEAEVETASNALMREAGFKV